MTYLRPKTLEEALDVLDSGDWTVAAGCTDLFPATEARGLTGTVLDVSGIAGLRGIRQNATGWSIGATTTWRDICDATLPAAFHGLQLAAREVGATQIQNRGTIAGNLCNASPAADGVPPLLTLDAVVELQSRGGVRTLRLQDFLRGPRQTDLQKGEVLTAVHIPNDSAAGIGSFQKLGARSYLVISIAMCAVRITLQAGRVADAALAVGACGPVAVRLRELEQKMIGKPLDDRLIEDADVAKTLSPIDDMRADAAYRAHAAAEILRRMVSGMTERCPA